MIATESSFRPREGASQRGMQCTSGINVGLWDRWLSMAVGTVLATKGLFRRWPGGLVLTLGGGYLVYRGWTGRCSTYRAMGVESVDQPVVDVHQQVTVAREPDEVYRFWRDFNNLPKFIKHLARVTPTGDGRAHWVVQLPGGYDIAWDTEIVEDREGVQFVCEPTAGQDIEGRGEIHFNQAPGDRGTEVHVRLIYRPSGDLLRDTAAWAMKALASMQLKEDLRRFKQVIESGQIGTSKGQPSSAGTPGPEQLDIYRQGATQPERAKSPEPGKAPQALSASEPARVSDPVAEASEESFPASDAPGWSSSTIGNPKHN
jgi:uncharacterized membrane protein